MRRETLAGVALVAAGIVGAARSARWSCCPVAAALDASSWVGWATVSGIALLYAGARGATR